MNIGINLDNTITEVQNELDKAAKETISKLRELGHKIYIITARDSEFHDDPYDLSKNWLDKNNIEYDKIIVNARKKAPICKEENIDLFIDDKLNDCLDVEQEGIQVIRISDDNEAYPGIVPLNNWDEIYNFIINEKICKIVKFDDCKIKYDVNNFISECMHNFIGRPYKDRPDVMDIENYYLKNSGQFFIAYDVNDNQLIGTIAIENRGQYGILKRFYVKENYQRNGMGRRLFNSLEFYIREKTNINKIYLTCGSVLKRAHIFYKNNNFKQIHKLDIEMHFADDDDFFVKKIERKIV